MNDKPATSCMHWLMALLVFLIPLFCGTGSSQTAIGDQVELKATHQAGVPLHQGPGHTSDFQRIPDGTRAQVTDVAKGGQWLKLSLPDDRTGWVTSRYIRSPTTRAPSSDSSTAKKPQHIEEGTVTRVADGDTLTVITPNQTKLRIRMFGIDTPETPELSR